MEDEALPAPRAGEVSEVLSVAAAAAAQGRAALLVTVLARRGSTPATPGQKLVWTEDGLCVGTVGGGALERAALREAAPMLELARRGDGLPRVVTHRLGPELGMCCGGSVDLLIEPVVSALPVGIVGAGHVARAAVPLLRTLAFAVAVSDSREAWALPSAFDGAVVRCGGPDELAAHVAPRGALLVMTHDHQLDQAAIEWALRARYAFVGGVGSRAKAARTRARLEARGFSPEDLDRVRMPVGLDIGARSPAEIAVAIAAELVAWRRAQRGANDTPR